MESELTFREMVDGISALVAVLTPDGALEFVNRQLLEYFGKTLEELKEWATTDAVHPDDLPRVIAVWTRSIESGEPYDVELRQRRADGVYRWFHVQGLPVRDAKGCIVRWCVLQTDVDERKHAEEALRESERELRQLIDSVPGMIAVANAKGESEYLNKRARDYLDTTAEGFRDRPMDTLHPEDQELVTNAWLRSNALRQPMDLDHRLRRKDGVYRWVNVRAEPLLDDRGRILRWYSMFTDIDDQRSAEEALRNSERELRLIIDSVPGMIAVGDSTSQLEYANKRFLDFTGRTFDEQRESGFETVHPDERELMQKEWLRSQALGQPIDVAHRLKRFDGVYRWVRVRVEPLLDDRGRIVRWYGLHTDIDDQRRAEEALRQTERELRQIVDSVPGMIVVANAEGRQEYGNKRFLDYTGKTVEELLGFDGLKLIHPDEQERVTNEWLRVSALGQPLELDHRMKRFDGVYRWMHVRVEPLLDDRGSIVRWYGLLTDIDDQRRAEEALRERERHLRLLVETIPALVSRSKPNGKLEYVDRRVVDYTGREMEQIDLDVIHPDDQSSHVQKWQRAMETGEPWDDTYRIRRADGEYRWFYDRVEPLRDGDGRVVSWYAVKIDINDSREMEEALRSTRRKLSAARQIATVAELSASIAHEINQPLASVVTNAHAAQTWLLHDPPNLERAQATLDRIIRDGHSAAEVVRRIRALFKESAPVKALVDINQIVAEVLRLLADELRDNSIIVETDPEDGLPMIDADHVQIQQTLINLVHNAIEAMAGVTDRAKSLRLSSRCHGEGVLIQVRDNGSGIKDPMVIFEPFFTTKESGMGMGLSISRSIVEGHGGRIWATANDDCGMTFSFTLPLTCDEPDRQSTRPPSSA
jgi:PAS domain S-box-containing protein